jgi:hypothetical protein
VSRPFETNSRYLVAGWHSQSPEIRVINQKKAIDTNPFTVQTPMIFTCTAPHSQSEASLKCLSQQIEISFHLIDPAGKHQIPHQKTSHGPLASIERPFPRFWPMVNVSATGCSL